MRTPRKVSDVGLSYVEIGHRRGGILWFVADGALTTASDLGRERGSANDIRRGRCQYAITHSYLGGAGSEDYSARIACGRVDPQRGLITWFGGESQWRAKHRPLVVELLKNEWPDFEILFA